MHPSFELLSFVARSENRVEALLALESGPASRSAVQESTGIPRATLSRILSDLRDRDLADRSGHVFTITPLGRLLARELRSLFDSLEVGVEIQSLAPWLPLDELGIDVEDLRGARVTLPTPVEPLAPVHRTAERLTASDRVRGLCNNVIPELLSTLSDAVVEAGLRVDVVVTADALEAVRADPTASRAVGAMLASGRLDLAVCPERVPQLAIEADGTVMLEVTDDEGAIHGLVETENDAVRSWFESAFAGYRDRTDRVTPERLAP